MNGKDDTMKNFFYVLIICATTRIFAGSIDSLDPLSEKDMQLNTTLLRMFERIDPYPGTVADQPVPGKAEFSYFREKSVDDQKLFFDVGNNAVSRIMDSRYGKWQSKIFQNRGLRSNWSGIDR